MTRTKPTDKQYKWARANTSQLQFGIFERGANVEHFDDRTVRTDGDFARFGMNVDAFDLGLGENVVRRAAEHGGTHLNHFRKLDRLPHSVRALLPNINLVQLEYFY